MRFDPFDSGVNTWQYCCWDTDGGGGGGGGGGGRAIHRNGRSISHNNRRMHGSIAG